MAPFPGSLIAGKYRLERPLAQGGMGSVWVAHNDQLDVPVAVKFMAPALVASAELVARFEREAKAAAQLRHPNVVQVFEHGVHEGVPFMAMELLEGESLGARLKARGGRLTLAETSRVLGEVCLALRRAHEKGLVHRDLKPANIFLCRHDDLEVVKVLDFGIAKTMSPSAQDEITKTGAVLGSPHYMSPEQARRSGKQVDHRADLWALGVIAFRCLAGRVPFPGDDTIEVLVRVCTEDPPPPSAVAPDLGPEIDRFTARALARDPDARFQSAREFADALAGLAEQAARNSVVSIAGVPPGAHVPPPPTIGHRAGQDVSDAMTTLPLPHAGAPSVAAASAAAHSTYADSPTVYASSPGALSAGVPGAGQAGRPFGPPEPAPSGTLTSAGTEVAARMAARPTSWVIPLAAVAALVAVLVVVLAVAVGRDSPDAAAEGPGEAAPGSLPVPATAISVVPAPSPPPGPSATAATTTEPAASATAPSRSASSTAADVPRPAAPGTKPAGAGVPGKRPDSGFLRPAQF